MQDRYAVTARPIGSLQDSRTYLKFNPQPQAADQLLAATLSAYESAVFGVHVSAGVGDAGWSVLSSGAAGPAGRRGPLIPGPQSGRGNSTFRPAATYASTASGHGHTMATGDTASDPSPRPLPNEGEEGSLTSNRRTGKSWPARNGQAAASPKNAAENPARMLRESGRQHQSRGKLPGHLTGAVAAEPAVALPLATQRDRRAGPYTPDRLLGALLASGGLIAVLRSWEDRFGAADRCRLRRSAAAGGASAAHPWRRSSASPPSRSCSPMTVPHIATRLVNAPIWTSWWDWTSASPASVCAPASAQVCISGQWHDFSRAAHADRAQGSRRHPLAMVAHPAASVDRLRLDDSWWIRIRWLRGAAGRCCARGGVLR